LFNLFLVLLEKSFIFEINYVIMEMCAVYNNSTAGKKSAALFILIKVNR